MTEISYTVNNEHGTIHWEEAEQFEELKNKKFYLREMKATQIEKLQSLSITAKILLSAVAGAIIQHLLDSGIEIDQIVSSGSFTVKE